MTTKVGLNEDEYLALVERIQKAMCIEPFRPDVTDVVVLIGTVQILNREIERLRAALNWHATDNMPQERLAREMFAEAAQMDFNTPQRLATHWAADGRERGEFHDCAGRAMRAIVRIVKNERLWSEWEQPAGNPDRHACQT
jgi:hypothetical protein